MAAPTDQTDPLGILRLALGIIMLFATAAALALGLSGIEPRALILAGGLWSLYGVSRALVSGFLAPSTEWMGRILGNGGGMRVAPQHSEIDALAAQGRFADAAERWFRVAADSDAPAGAMLRRAELLAGPLQDPGSAAAELTQFRDGPRRPLTAAEDVTIGLALVDIYEHRLQEPSRAMFELRRLLDRYPQSRHVRRIRATLNELKERRFGDAFDPPSEP
jgi:hypothetical protein